MPTATIVVTDLVGSTELRTRLGEEAADRLHRLHDRLLRDAVEAHGGVVVKGLGDGILASFTGAAEAVSCAVAVQQAAGFHSRRHPDQALILRVGLSAGDVTLEEDGDRVGTPVIEAARLCAAARGGQILAADLVRALARGRGGHRFTVVGDLELKGLAEPVATVEIGWVETRPVGAELSFPPLLLAGGALGFAGRAQELDVLGNAWKEATAGVRRAVLIAGEPGVGKTRLAAEAARRAHDGGGAVLYGRCEEDLGVPYEPFVEALRWFCDHVPADPLASRLGRYPGELARLLPELGQLLPGLDPPLRSDPETEQYRFFEAVASWLAAAGDPGGLLVVIDDLHWAPAPTIALLAHVLRAGGPAPLCVVATFRDTDVGPEHPLTPVLGDLRRSPGVDRLAISGLSVDELAHLLETQAQTARALAVSLHDATEGNPFFVAEVLRDVAESDLAEDPLPVPEGVRDVILSRLGRLPAPTRELLGVASVLGRNTDLAPLAATAGITEDDAVAAMDEALAVRLVEETGVGAYRFVHALVRSALADTLSETRRARLHLRAADVFEGDAVRVAQHLLACAPLADPARTATACLAAGDLALSALADAEAALWYSQGLHCPADQPDLRIDLLTGLGEAQRRSGDPASRETLLEASRLARNGGDVDRLVRAVLTNSRPLSSVVGDVDEDRIELITVALEAAGPAPTAERAQLLALFASELMFAGDHTRVLRAGDEAAAIAERLGDDTLRARVGARRLWACLVPDRTIALAREGPAIVGFADAGDDPKLAAMTRTFAVAAHLAAGELAAARLRGAEAMAIADETGEPGLRCLARLFYAGALDAVGGHEEAARLTQVGFDLGQEAGWWDAVAWYGGRMSVHWTFEGQPDVAASVAQQTFATFPSMIPFRAWWAFCRAVSGPDDEAAGFIRDTPAILPTMPVDVFSLETHFFIGCALGFGIEDRQAAADLYERLSPYRDLHASFGIGYWGPLEVALAVAARVKGDVEAALAHHEAVAATIDACGAARARALNGYQWAATLLTLGDRQAARAMAEETLEYCRTKGYTTFVTKTEELLASMG